MKRFLMWMGLVIGALILWWAAMESAEGAVGGVVGTGPGVKATDVNPNVQTYMNTGIYCSVIMTNNQYVISGAAGTHVNSGNTGVNFAGANQTYTWCTTCKGNAIGTTTNTGLFQGNSDPTWVISYQYYSPSVYPAWVVYNTNTWIYSGASGTNGVLRFGQDNSVLQSVHNDNYLPDMAGVTNFGAYIPDTNQGTNAGNYGAATITPVYTTNTFQVAASVYEARNYLLNFPHVGPTRTTATRANVQPPYGVFSANIAGNGVIHLTNGCGVLRNIEVMPSQFLNGASGNLRSNYWVQIFPDYGTNSTTFVSVNSNLMTFNVPLTALMSCKWDNTNVVTGIPGMSWHQEALNVSMGNYSGTNPAMKLTLLLNCPYTNGMFARVIDQLNQVELSAQFYATADYEVDATGALNYPFRDWRLHGVNTRFTCIEPNAQGATDWTKTQVTMFTATNCPGVLVGFWAGLDGLNGPNPTSGSYPFPMETGTWQWRCDGQNPPAMLMGEDAFVGTPYECFLPAPILALTYGLVNRVGDSVQTGAFPKSIDAYRYYPVSWQNSVTALLTTGSPGGAFSGDITTVYYSAP